MLVSYQVSFVFTVVSVFLLSALFSFGACYNGCDWLTYLYSNRFLIPLLGTLATQHMAIIHWNKNGITKRWHLGVIGLSGLTLIIFSSYAIFVDPGDTIIYSVFLSLGILIGQPLVVQLFGKN